MSELGIEITIEPNVVPKGTLDLRSLDARPGTVPPPVRVEANGRVVRLASAAKAPATTADWPAPGTESMDTGVLGGGKPATPAAPATPAVQSSSVHRNQEALAVEGVRPAGVAISSAEPPATVSSALPPLGARLRKRASSGALPVADTAMPLRPASAGATSEERGPRPGSLPPADDYETTQISGGFASSLAALVKVTLVLVGVTLAVALPLLRWTDLWPAGTQVATNDSSKKHDAPPSVAPTNTSSETKPADFPRPDSSSVATATVVEKPAEVASVATAASSAVALGVTPEPPKKPDAAPVVVAQVGASEKDKTEPAVKIEAEPKVSADVSGDSDIDIRKVESLRADGVRLYRSGKFDEAIAKFDALLAASPKDSDALFRKAFAMHLKGDLKAAEAAYQLAALAAAPKDARPWNNLGLVRERLGDAAGARTAYQRGLAANPHDSNVLTNLGVLDRDANPKQALKLYEQALREDSRNPYARYERAALVALTLAPGDESARRDLEALAGEDTPLRAKALDALGQLASQGKKPGDAEKYYRRALDADPTFEEARLHLGVALYANGANDKAETELRAYLEKHPKSADAWKTLGAALVRLDRLPEAKAAYERALAENDKDVTTLYNYALCAERFGNFLFAIQEYERVVQLDPRHWKSLENLGLLYRHAGRYEKALEYFKKALAVQPGNADVHLHCANAHKDLNHEADMRSELQEFVRLAPPGDKRVADAQKALASTADSAPTATNDVPPPASRGF